MDSKKTLNVNSRYTISYDDGSDIEGVCTSLDKATGALRDSSDNYHLIRMTPTGPKPVPKKGQLSRISRRGISIDKLDRNWDEEHNMPYVSTRYFTKTTVRPLLDTVLQKGMILSDGTVLKPHDHRVESLQTLVEACGVETPCDITEEALGDMVWMMWSKGGKFGPRRSMSCGRHSPILKRILQGDIEPPNPKFDALLAIIKDV